MLFQNHLFLNEFKFDPWVKKIPWRKTQQSTPVDWRFLRIPWTEEPGSLQSKGSHRVKHN